MTETYLRRRPAAGWLQSGSARRALAAALAVLVFAVVDTTASVRVTRLARGVAEGEEAINRLESELSYLVREQERLEASPIDADEKEKDDVFAAPDSGSVVIVVTEAQHAGFFGGH